MRIFLFFTILVALFACSNEQKSKSEELLFAEYYLRYLESEGEMKAEATFAKGKDKKSARKTDLEGTITINGMGLDPIKIDGKTLRYQQVLKAKFKDNYTFQFIDDLDQKTDHAIRLAPINKFTIKSNTVSKIQGFTLEWVGSPLEKNEQLLVMITDKNGKAHSVTFNGATTTSSVQIPSSELTPLSEGEGYIYLVKKQAGNSNSDKMHILSEMEYYSDKLEVLIAN